MIKKGKDNEYMIPDKDSEEGKWERRSTEALLWNKDTPRASE